MARETTALKVNAREPDGSRGARRLRREGDVPGIVYGGGEDPVTFKVPARDSGSRLRTPARCSTWRSRTRRDSVVLKELERHPVSGETCTSTCCAYGST